jgi:hypothetical protein
LIRSAVGWLWRGVDRISKSTFLNTPFWNSDSNSNAERELCNSFQIINLKKLYCWFDFHISCCNRYTIFANELVKSTRWLSEHQYKIRWESDKGLKCRVVNVSIIYIMKYLEFFCNFGHNLGHYFWNLKFWKIVLFQLIAWLCHAFYSSLDEPPAMVLCTVHCISWWGIDLVMKISIMKHPSQGSVILVVKAIQDLSTQDIILYLRYWSKDI